MYDEEIKYIHFEGNNLEVEVNFFKQLQTFLESSMSMIDSITFLRRRDQTLLLQFPHTSLSYYLSQKLICTLRNVREDRVTHLLGKKLLQNRIKCQLSLKLNLHLASVGWMTGDEFTLLCGLQCLHNFSVLSRRTPTPIFMEIRQIPIDGVKCTTKIALQQAKMLFNHFICFMLDVFLTYCQN